MLARLLVVALMTLTLPVSVTKWELLYRSNVRLFMVGPLQKYKTSSLVKNIKFEFDPRTDSNDSRVQPRRSEQEDAAKPSQSSMATIVGRRRID